MLQFYFFSPSLSVPPSSPTLLFASAISPSSFSIQWTPSTNDGGSPITAYVIEYRDTSVVTSPFRQIRVDSDTTSTRLEGLMAFVNYDIRIRAENAVGLSDPSNSLSGRTHPAGECAFCCYVADIHTACTRVFSIHESV